MPEVASIRSATLERPGGVSPGVAAEQPAGLGADAAESLAGEAGGGEDLAATNARLQKEIRRIQSIADKRADELREAKQSAAEAQAARVLRETDAEVASFEARIAAAQYDPEALQALVGEIRQERLDAAKRTRSDTWLDMTLASFEAETGQKVARDDPRLNLPQAGESLTWEAGTARVRRALAGIKAGGSAGASGVAHEETLAELKALREELAALKDATGATRFDGGSASGGSSGLTLEQYTAMSYEERRKLKPADVNAMTARARR